MTTSAPKRQSSSAVAWPMPLVAPVTNARRPPRENGSVDGTSDRRPATVDGVDRAGDVTRLGRRQERDDFGDLLCLRGPADDGCRADRLGLFGRLHRGVD